MVVILSYIIKDIINLPAYCNKKNNFITESTMSGFDCVIVSSVPVGAGLSSSAAVEVVTYTLLESLLNSPSSKYFFLIKIQTPNCAIYHLYFYFSLKSKALACQKAEHEYANVPCGIMDQFVCTMAKAGCAFLLDCKYNIKIDYSKKGTCALTIKHN